MLNETLEFESYIIDPESAKPRLQPKYLTNSFSITEDKYSLHGIDQVLTIVARGFLFSEYALKIYSPDEIISDDTIDATAEVLARWFGCVKDDHSNETWYSCVEKWFRENKQADGWFEKYWKYHYKNQKKDVTPDEIEEKWSSCVKEWSEKFYGFSFTAKGHSFHNIIANAIEAGPLKERYLVVKKGYSEKGLFRYLYDYEGKTSPHIETEIKLLKTIAAYLILRENHPTAQTEVLLQRGRLLGWFGQDDAKNEAKLFLFKKLSWDKQPIVTRGAVVGQYIKLIIDPDYLERFDYKIIEKSQVELYKDDYWILQDPGYDSKTHFIRL